MAVIVEAKVQATVVEQVVIDVADPARSIEHHRTILGNAGVNIATFNLGRRAQGGEAICLVSIDEAPPAAVLQAVAKLPQVKQAKPLAF